MRSDTTEIETCRNELTDQHRTLTLIARTLNSTRSSKRAKETGVLEARLQEQLHALEVIPILYNCGKARVRVSIVLS